MMRHTEPMGEWVPGEEFAETLKRRLARIEEIEKAIGILEEERDHLILCMNAKPYFTKDT